MTAPIESFATWLSQARVPEPRLSPDQLGLLRAVFHFRQQQGTDYYSTRLLSHFLLHCACGLKVAQLARLLGCVGRTGGRASLTTHDASYSIGLSTLPGSAQAASSVRTAPEEITDK